jgi:hypothetical protein
MDKDIVTALWVLIAEVVYLGAIIWWQVYTIRENSDKVVELLKGQISIILKQKGCGN